MSGFPWQTDDTVVKRESGTGGGLQEGVDDLLIFICLDAAGAVDDTALWFDPASGGGKQLQLPFGAVTDRGVPAQAPFNVRAALDDPGI